MYCPKCGTELKDGENCVKCSNIQEKIVPSSVKDEKFKDYFVLSIVAFLFCIPFAIVSTIYSVKAKQAKENGDIERAIKESKKAGIWVLLSYASIILVFTTAILAAIAIPSFANQVKKSKDAKAIAVLGSARLNLSMAVADMDGNYPDEDSWKQLVFGGEVTCKKRGLKAKIQNIGSQIVEEAADEEFPIIAYVKCGTAKKGNTDYKEIPIKYVLTQDEEGNNIGTIVFEEGYTDSKGRNWDTY